MLSHQQRVADDAAELDYRAKVSAAQHTTETFDLKISADLLRWMADCLEQYGHVDDDEGDVTESLRRLVRWLDAHIAHATGAAS